MRMVDLIEKKVDGGALSHDEIETMIKGYVDGEIPDYDGGRVRRHGRP